jgi:hypothetical protein
LLIDTRDTGKLFNSGFLDTLQTAEMGQKRPASARTNTRDAFENRLHSGFLTPAAVTCNGKAVCLIANLLNQV